MSKLEELLWSAEEHGKRYEMFKEIPFNVSEVQDLLIEGLDKAYNNSETVEEKTNYRPPKVIY